MPTTSAARRGRLRAADARLAAVRMYVRLAHRWHWINHGQHEHVSQIISEIGRLLWQGGIVLGGAALGGAINHWQAPPACDWRGLWGLVRIVRGGAFNNNADGNVVCGAPNDNNNAGVRVVSHGPPPTVPRGGGARHRRRSWLTSRGSGSGGASSLPGPACRPGI